MISYGYFLLCSVCACLVTSYVLLDKIKWKTKIPIYIFVWIINAFVIGCAGLYYYPFIKILVVILNGLILGFMIGHYRKKELLEYVFFSILISLCDFISYPILRYLQSILTNFQSMNMQIHICLLVSSQILVLYVYRLYKHVIRSDRERTPMFVSIFQILILPVFTVINLVFMQMIAVYYLFPWILGLMFVDIVFVISLNIYLFFLIDKMEENHQLKEKAMLFEEMAQMQYQYYQHLEEKYQSSRQVIHDVKRHMQVLEYPELPREMVSTYVHDMNEMLHCYSQEIYSKHPILNIILNEKVEVAKRNQIEVSCQIAPVDVTFLRDIDVTVIFANLLDNAIDACKEVSIHRYLHLQMEQVHDFLVIKIQNSSVGKRNTKQSNKAGHAGLGLQNVRQTLEKYGGTIQVVSEETMFMIHLYLPMR